MAQTKGNASASAANGVEKKKKEKCMPKALQRKLEGIKAAKIALGTSKEEVLFDGKEPPPSGYDFLPKGNSSLTRTCRLRTRNADQTYFTVYDSATYAEQGMYVPTSVLVNATQDATKAAEVRKRKDDKKKAEEAAIKKKAPKKNSANDNNVSGKKGTAKKATTAAATSVNKNTTKGKAKGAAKTASKATFLENATKNESAAEESIKGVGVTGYVDKVPGQAEITGEHNITGKVQGEDTIGHASDEITLHETGSADIGCKESSNADMQADSGDTTGDDYVEEGLSGGEPTEEEVASAASINTEDASNDNNY